MFKGYNITRNLISLFVCLITFISHAAETQPKFTIIPYTPTTVFLLNGGQAQVGYQVTNQTLIRRTLTIVPTVGVTQVSPTPQSCSNPFTLDPQQSCTLVLNITAPVYGGPQVCKTYGPDINYPDPFLCSQPGENDILNASYGYSLSGTVSGLTGTLVLQNNGGIPLTLNANGVFSFPRALPPGGSYSVTIQSQPANQVCTVSNGSGTNVNSNITNVSITCRANVFTVGGSVSNLTANGLILQNNGGDNLPLPAGTTSFQFPTPLVTGSGYNVTVLQQPTGLTCTVSNGSGTITNNVTNVNVACAVNTYTIGGSVANLTANGLILQNNGGDNLAVPAGATTFQFSVPIASGGNYNVTILQQPTGLICTVTNGSGMNIMSNITSVNVNCSISTFTIGGSIANLTGNGLVLRNTINGDNLVVGAGATTFQFPTPVAYGDNYNTIVLTQPAGLTCLVSNGSGSNVMNNITTIQVTCTVNTYTIGGTITNLTADGLVIQNTVNGEQLTLNSGASTYQFPTQVSYGDSYNVIILQQPDGLTCSISNSSAMNVMSNVTNVNITCNIATYTIGGGVSGLTANGLVLNNASTGENLAVPAGSTTFQFQTPVPFGGSYSVTVLTQPTGLTCTVSNSSGTSINSNITTIVVVCSTTTFTIGGTITGLTAPGLTLENNNDTTDDLMPNAGDTVFQFTKPVAFGGSYNVIATTQPPGLTCTVNNGSDDNVTANITNITVTCDPITFTVGGSISGLTANGLVLRNNGGDDISPPLGATSFQFPTPIAFNGSYNVTIAQQPNRLNCTLANASGDNVMGNVIDVAVTCVPALAFITQVTNPRILACLTNLDGSIGNCADTGYTSIQYISSITFNRSRTQAYLLVGLGTTTIVRCQVLPNGTFGACTPTGSGLVIQGGNELVFNNTNQIAYITSSNSVGPLGNQVLRCPVALGGAIGACVDSGNTGAPFTGPFGIALNNAAGRAYVTNLFGNTVSTCPINPDGSFGACSLINNTGVPFSAPAGITLNRAGSVAYIANNATNSTTVLRCPVNTNGSFGPCADSGNSGLLFGEPFVITLNKLGNQAYVVNSSPFLSLSRCPINPDGSFGACLVATSASGATIDGPTDVAFR